MEPNDRLHALDAVRAHALLLGVVLHTAAAFLENFPMPIWRDEPSTVASVAYYVIHMFRMSAFFLIAGFFARMLVERRGVNAFIRDRGKRIALPLFVFGPVILISIGVAAMLGMLVHGLDYVANAQQEMLAEQQAAAGPAAEAAAGINTAHLWFLYYLLIFYAATLAVRALVHAVDRKRRAAAALDRVVGAVMGGLWAPLVIAVPLVAYFSQVPDWNEWIGLPAPVSFVPQAQALVGYGVPFALGWLLHRQVPTLLDLRRSWHVYLAAAVVLTVVCLSLVGTGARWQGPNLAGAERAVYTAAYMVGLWCWVLGFVGAAVRFLSHESRVNRYLADASYWIYLMHMTTILFFIALLRPYDWHWAVKFVIVIGGSMPILLASYQGLVRFTWLGAVLNGRRRRRPLPPSANAAPA